jgi:hypothetical protein
MIFSKFILRFKKAIDWRCLIEFFQVHRLVWLGIRDDYRTLAELTDETDEEAMDNV